MKPQGPSGTGPTNPFVGPKDLAAFDPERDLSFPGEFPFTRGIQPTMYRGRLWTMRQYAGFGTAAETNERFHHLLAAGQTVAAPARAMRAANAAIFSQAFDSLT